MLTDIWRPIKTGYKIKKVMIVDYESHKLQKLVEKQNIYCTMESNTWSTLIL